MKNIDQFLDAAFNGLTPNQRKVLLSRFGLKTGKPATLQAVGDELGITRERVRQIQEQAMKKLTTYVRGVEGSFVQSVVAELAATGGVRGDAEFLKDIRRSFFPGSTAKHLDQKARFVLFAAGAPSYHREDDEVRAYWYASDAAHRKFVEFVKATTNVFKSTDRQEFFNRKVYLAVMKDPVSAHHLSIPKRFGVNVFGDMGLREWPEIEPKTVRDKAYLVLKKSNQPLHFEDITKHITKLGIDRKRAHVQTVHNELIKDDRFVLVGRGMYGLREQGYQPGTVREVVARLLRKHGALQAHEVVAHVNRERFLKENTILLALQNRKFFKRLDDGRYHVREA